MMSEKFLRVIRVLMVLTLAFVAVVLLLLGRLSVEHYYICQDVAVRYPEEEFRWVVACWLKRPAYGGGFYWQDVSLLKEFMEVDDDTD